MLAISRVVRLVGWDHMPFLVKARAWVTGEYRTSNGSTNARLGVTNEQVQTTVAHRRQWIADLISCPFCLGLWLSAAVYVAWRFEPRWTLYGAVPLAISTLVGTWVRFLDP
jgi:hypothetical protein